MPSPDSRSTVRDATFDVLREHRLTTLFSNPGSTEVPFLADLPDDLDFVLGLHEGAVVGIATGWAIAHDRTALVLLHTTAGLGNAVGALATARVNRAPMVVIVGQQDRRHLALEPFLAGRLAGLAGDYPVAVEQPVRAQDVPAAIAHAAHAARTAKGPAIVIVPMDDWAARATRDGDRPGAGRVLRPPAVDDDAVAALAELLATAQAPAIVVGAGTDRPEGWQALGALADRLDCPVYQEPFGARAGFAQDDDRFAGHLPADRRGLRRRLAAHDAVLVAGAPAFRQYPYAPGPLVAPGTAIAVVTDDPGEAHRSPAELVVLGDPAAVCSALAARVPQRSAQRRSVYQRPKPLVPPAAGEALLPGHVFDLLADRLPAETVVVEESPSSRPELHERLPARAPLGFLSAAMGGLGFALPAAIGVRMARPDRPVVAIVGDGSSLYQIQALWSARRYGVGVLFVVLANGGYSIMDRLAAMQGGSPPWPGFPELSIAGMAEALGCPARRVHDHSELTAVLDDIVPSLAARTEPLVLEIAVRP